MKKDLFVFGVYLHCRVGYRPEGNDMLIPLLTEGLQHLMCKSIVPKTPNK
jgi:hypothetical protein